MMLAICVIFVALMVGMFVFFQIAEKNNKAADNDTKTVTANELTNVKDVKGHFLYTRDGYIFAYIKIPSFNTDLLSQEEKRVKAATLAASFEGDRKPFTYFSYPREVDLDRYKQDIKDFYIGESDLGRKRILQIMLQEAAELATNGENFEHQHYIRIWKKIGNDQREAEKELLQRAEEFKTRYQSIGVNASILLYEEIIRLCNLFANPIQSPFDNNPDNSYYEPILNIK